MISVQQFDKKEVLARVLAAPYVSMLDTEKDLLHHCLTMSLHKFIGMINDEIACVWGLIPPSMMSSQAYIWMYTTTAIKGNEFLFVRHSQRVLEELFEHYDCIVGHCSINATQSIRWIKWLGGKFGQPEGKGIPFTIRKPANG